MEFNVIIPELSVSDIKKSLWFYVDVIGFKIEYERPDDKFAFLSYGGAQIMIEQINGHWDVAPLEYPFGRGINFQIEVSDVEKISARLTESNISLFKKISISTYKAGDTIFTQKELLVQDPDGYLLRFSQTI